MATGKRGKGAAVPPRAAEGKPDDAPRKTHAITRLDDGTICIGDGCAVVRIPPKGDVEIDLADCDESVRHALVDRISEGAGADFKIGRKK